MKKWEYCTTSSWQAIYHKRNKEKFLVKTSLDNKKPCLIHKMPAAGEGNLRYWYIVQAHATMKQSYNARFQILLYIPYRSYSSNVRDAACPSCLLTFDTLEIHHTNMSCDTRSIRHGMVEIWSLATRSLKSWKTSTQSKKMTKCITRRAILKQSSYREIFLFLCNLFFFSFCVTIYTICNLLRPNFKLKFT